MGCDVTSEKPPSGVMDTKSNVLTEMLKVLFIITKLINNGIKSTGTDMGALVEDYLALIG
jgi:hypothetical protein